MDWRLGIKWAPMFRFTIRDVLWLMVVVGLVAGWMADNLIKTARYEFLLQEYEKILPHVPAEHLPPMSDTRFNSQ
jgi:uncharacterized membrane protein